MKLIIIQPPVGHLPQMVFEGGRRASFLVPGQPFNHDREEQPQFRQATVFLVEDEDLDAAVRELTTWHPGVDVTVYSPERIFQRPAGEMQEKLVTKEGILPF